MVAVKYKSEMLSNMKDFILKDYEKSWLYQIYEIPINNNGFIDKNDLEKLSKKNRIEFFLDFSTYISGEMSQDQLSKCSFELIFLETNEQREVSEYLGLNRHPPLILLKHVLYNGKYELSYQTLDEINTVMKQQVDLFNH